MIKTVAQITSVERRQTRAGKTFGVISDLNGVEYTSWADNLTIQAEELQGKVAQIGFDEVTKGQYTNRTLRFLQETGDSGSEQSYDSPVAGPVSEPVSFQERKSESVGVVDGDWLGIVRTAAGRGEWRAAEALQRREDIARSVALNNTIRFFEYIAEENRTPDNVKTVFGYMLKALNES